MRKQREISKLVAVACFDMGRKQVQVKTFSWPLCQIVVLFLLCSLAAAVAGNDGRDQQYHGRSHSSSTRNIRTVRQRQYAPPVAVRRVLTEVDGTLKYVPVLPKPASRSERNAVAYQERTSNGHSLKYPTYSNPSPRQQTSILPRPDAPSKYNYNYPRPTQSHGVKGTNLPSRYLRIPVHSGFSGYRGVVPSAVTYSGNQPLLLQGSTNIDEYIKRVFKTPGLKLNYDVSGANTKVLRFQTTSMDEAEKLLKGITGNFRVRLQDALEMPDRAAIDGDASTSAVRIAAAITPPTNAEKQITVGWHRG